MSAWRGLPSDFTLAVRRLRQHPAFTAISILTLAVGIGGNAAVFTLIDRVLLKPLPVQRPAELYRLGDVWACCVNSGLPGSFSLFSYDLYIRLRDAAPQFTPMAAFQANTRVVTFGRVDAGTPPETLNGVFVSGNYFQTFELVPAAGRLIHPGDDQPGAPPVAVITYRAWTERFQARADVVGSTVALNGVPATIVGVAPEGFYGEALRVTPAEIWMPLSTEPLLQPAARLLEAKGSHWLYVVGRLKPGTPLPPIDAQLTSTLQQWIVGTLQLSARDRDQVPRQHITITSAAHGAGELREEVAPTLRLLQALAAAVLLIACANLANLLLARGAARRTETAVRAALGASRSRLIVQSLVESTLLACAGGLAGLAVSFAGARAIINLAFRGATDIPVDPSPSLLVVGVAFAASLATGIVFGVAPAIVGSRSDPVEAMRTVSRTTTEHGSRLRSSLIALQVAVSVVLITCAGLLGRSLANLETQDFGVRLESRYVLSLAPALGTVPADQLPSLYRRMQASLRGVPGVVNAAFSLYAPMSGDNWSGGVVVDGHAASERLSASWNRVSPGYFDTVGTPLVRGRAFDERDGPSAPLVAIVTQSFARKFFGDADPIGRRVGFPDARGEGTPDMEIVGVVGDAKYHNGRRPVLPTFFMPFLQQGQRERAEAARRALAIDRSHYPQAIEIHAVGAAPTLEGDIRRVLAEVDRRITVRTMLPMDEQVAREFNIERLIARLTTTFGLVALLLACLGLYGVTAYSVSRRTREIGVRMAMGASSGRVLGTVIRGALVQVAVGIAIGLPAAFAAARMLQARLFGIGAHDPLVLASGLALLGMSAALAALLPARRAAATDPAVTLRQE
jgi:macrolide transport system ATP-binding/permease protein